VSADRYGNEALQTEKPYHFGNVCSLSLMIGDEDRHTIRNGAATAPANCIGDDTQTALTITAMAGDFLYTIE
jgi:hypothetical protein